MTIAAASAGTLAATFLAAVTCRAMFPRANAATARRLVRDRIRGRRRGLLVALVSPDLVLDRGLALVLTQTPARVSALVPAAGKKHTKQ